MSQLRTPQGGVCGDIGGGGGDAGGANYAHAFPTLHASECLVCWSVVWTPGPIGNQVHVSGPDVVGGAGREC